MSTNKTTNYLMHSWVGTDYVKRTEFNENFNTIDTTMKALDTAVKGKADSGHTHSNAVANGASGFLTGADKAKIDGIASGAEVNQNTFANVAVQTSAGAAKGSTVVADSKSDTLTFKEGTGVVLTPDATNDIVTIAVDTTAIATKTHSHAISDVTGLQTALDGKAASSHGTHVPTPETANNAKFLRNDNTWQLVTPANIGAATSGHTHTDATTSAAGFMTAAQVTKLNGIATGAEVNQNAFTTIKVGATNIDADSKSDVFEMVAGANVTLTPDATNDKVTIAATVPVTKVNNKTGNVSLNSYDVGALPLAPQPLNMSGQLDSLTESGIFMDSYGQHPAAPGEYGSVFSSAHMVSGSERKLYQLYMFTEPGIGVWYRTGNQILPGNITWENWYRLGEVADDGAIPIWKLPSGSTSQSGIVQLSSATNSTSTTLAATPSAVKAAYDLANGKANASHTHSGTDITQASTTVRGTVQLLDSISSFSTTYAATPNSVKTAYDLANANKRADGTRSFVVETRTSDPASPVVGQMWLRTDL